jgi:hypothetical protein
MLKELLYNTHKITEYVMKTITFENIFNKEKFEASGKKEVKVIDGVEYYKLYKHGTKREVLVRKDFLKKIK